ncbi:MAG: DUF2922 domain-containing protein [Clostridiaceae bacterium]|nr:DUF2922 domain-containing protein [Clostridiaceae bacterium]MBW4860028.1 DUF2922 domain-containing protein [Clostridiaceae bacterium]MBW4867118.1 DUF2922 domain-containing protein [Clostridiaceae bacterium]
MENSKLQMIFKNLEDRRVTLSVDNPRNDLTGEEVRNTMDNIIETNVFDSNGGDITTTVGARIVRTTIEEIEI